MSLVDVLNAEARLLFDRDEDEHAPSLLLKAAARIRELDIENRKLYGLAMHVVFCCDGGLLVEELQRRARTFVEERDSSRARIRELEERSRDQKRLYLEAVQEIKRLEAQIAAHEKVCAGTWVRCSERLPTRGNCKTRGVHKVTRLLVEQNTNSTWVKDGKVLWFVQPESVEWEEWLDAKQPDEGVRE